MRRPQRTVRSVCYLTNEQSEMLGELSCHYDLSKSQIISFAIQNEYAAFAKDRLTKIREAEQYGKR